MANKKSNDSRRKLLKSIAVGSGAVVAGKSLPESWTKPVIDTVMLPAHAETSGCAIYAVSHIEFKNEGEDSLLTVCATVCGDSAEVTQATDWDNVGYNQRSGTIPIGGASGQMPQTAVAPGCEGDGPPSRSATLTDLTADSVVFTMERGQSAPGPLVVTLLRVDSCPGFSPLTWDCDT